MKSYSRFLPTVRPASQKFARTRTGAGRSGFAGVSIRILIVDDIQAWHFIYAAVLRQHSHCEIVGVARDGMEAIQKSQELTPDVIVLDVGLGDMAGFEAARRISQVSPASRVLFVGNAVPSELAEIALTTGGYGYISKRNVVLELVPALQAVVQGKQFLGQDIL